MGQSLWWAPSSFIRTMFPSVKFRLDDDHFLLGYMFCKYSCLHQSQSWSVRYCAHLQRQQAYRSVPTKTPGGMPAGSAFIVKSMEGKSGCGLAMLVGTKAMVRALYVVDCPYLPFPCSSKVWGVLAMHWSKNSPLSFLQTMYLFNSLATVLWLRWASGRLVELPYVWSDILGGGLDYSSDVLPN